MDSSAGRRIDWSRAEIEAGVLSLPLEGEAPKGFTKQLENVLALLDTSAHGWGEIAVHKNRITVAEVSRGAEDDLRHLLESALLQANADLDLTAGANPDELSDREQAMTDAFRSFADHDN